MNIEKLLTKAIKIDEGTNRDCYIFSNFVVKIPKEGWNDGEYLLKQSLKEIDVWNKNKGSSIEEILAKIYKVIYTENYPIIIMERITPYYELNFYSSNEIKNQVSKEVISKIDELSKNFNLSKTELFYSPNCGLSKTNKFKICDYGWQI